MGEVWRARDTRLDRTVAIKVLPSHLSSDLQFKQRFEREARAISSLSHPHICTLYDVGHQDGIDYLVMEYLEGQTLAERLRKGAVPLEEALRCAIQIAEALDKAHRQGIVHRDLKPGNIMLTKAGVKLLDFGLAKLFPVGTRSTASVKSNSRDGVESVLTELSGAPTVKEEITKEGTILGTLHYMAPEQLEGKQADTRTDIFAFGVVLYEMVTGKKAFTGKSQASLIAAILEREPEPISKLQPLGPPAFERVVKRCLAKEPDARWQTALDLLEEMKWIAEGGSQSGVPAPVIARRMKRERLAWMAAGLFALIAGVATFHNLTRPTVVEPHFVLSVVPPQNTVVGSLAVSPDGSRLAFTARDASGQSALWIRPLDSALPQPLPKTEGAFYPFWSPDSKSIAFFAEDKLKRIDATGGPILTLCDAPLGLGGTWNRDEVILFATLRDPLNRVSASGGVPTPLGRFDSGGQTANHAWPHFLPDGRHFLYFATASPLDASKAGGIYIASLDGKENRLLVRADGNSVYAKGHLLFLQGTALRAQPFDANALKTVGEPFTVADQVRFAPLNFLGSFSASETGDLVFDTGETSSQLIWFDRQGQPLDTLGDRSSCWTINLSPDESRLVVCVKDAVTQTDDFWIYDLSRGVPTRFTFDGSPKAVAVWSPDGTRIVFNAFRDGAYNLYQKAVGGNESEETVSVSKLNKYPSSWSPDGKHILCATIDNSRRNVDLWVFPMEGDRRAYLFRGTKDSENALQFAPDGRWVAYMSDETGRNEIYVTSFPEKTETTRVSTGGGKQPRWRRDGKELFYLAPDNKLMAVEVETKSPAFAVHSTRPLFPMRPASPFFSYDVSRDGQRFLVNTALESTNSSAITVVVNWTANLKKK